jgi:hypothetical protein
MAWTDPTQPSSDTSQQAPLPATTPAQSPSLPPISSYGMPGQTWNKETMELLVNIEIPKEVLAQGRNPQLFVWYKQALMQLQFGNFTKRDQDIMVKDLRYIIFLSQQDGNEQMVFEEQLIFISNLMISKGRSDKPDGLRERTMWIIQIMKNIFSQEEAKRPEESKGGWNIPFAGGNRQ